MMKKIAFFIVKSRVATVIASLLCIGLWLYAIMGVGQGNTLVDNVVWNYAVIVLYLLSGFLIVRFTRRYGISSKHTLLPLMFLVMGYSLVPQLPTILMGSLQLIVTIAAYHILQVTYRESYAMGSYFMAFAMLSAGTIVCPQLLFVVPLLILYGLPLQSLHFRTICASILGLLLPYWIAFSVLFLTDNMHRIPMFFASALPSSCAFPLGWINLPVSTFVIPIPAALIPAVWVMLILIPVSIYVITNSQMKVLTRASLYSTLLWMTILLAASVVFPALYGIILPALLFFTAVIGSSLFSGHLTQGRSIYLVVLVVCWLLFYSLFVCNIF